MPLPAARVPWRFRMLLAVRTPIQAAAAACGCKMLKEAREVLVHSPHLAFPLKGARTAARLPAPGREGAGGGLKSLSVVT